MDLDIISYRGPGKAGGVSSGLECLWRKQQNSSSTWWYLGQRFLEKQSPQYKNSNFVTMLREEVVAGHYRYCNDFLWPIMHDLPQYATYNSADHDFYRQFNLIFADYISYENAKYKRYFIQDYQLALLPRFMNIAGGKSNVFWHIPWPKNIPTEYIQPMIEIVRGLLRADVLGFHTAEYAHNFIKFVWQYLPEYVADGNSMFIHSLDQSLGDDEISRFFEANNYMTSAKRNRTTLVLEGTRVIVQPLGIDSAVWSGMANEIDNNITLKLEKYTKTPFILSVDRADYTKSVYERLQIIDRFFENNPRYISKLTFLQISGRTRPGLQAFDNYWQKCRELYQRICDRWQIGDWQPVIWIDEPLTPAELAFLYQQAKIMLVNPVRDGLNLTAKEFVACQNTNPGVLLLSEGAGAWHELGACALSATPAETDTVSKHILQALNMPISERRLRMELLKAKLDDNTLFQWWAQFTKVPRSYTQRSIPAVRKLA